MKQIALFFIFFSFVTQAQISDFKTENFAKADSVAKRYQNESLQNIPLLSYNLTSGLATDAEKFRAIYTWVCLNVKGDNAMHNKVTRKRKKFETDSTLLLSWNAEYKKHVYKRLIKRKRTMCTGYAYIVKELATFAGIECKIIDGYGRTPQANVTDLERANHSWNAVKLNNKWYLCDATWSSGYFDGNGLFISDYNDGYFLTHPELFVKSHYPLQEAWLLTDNFSTDNFVKAPLVYGEAFKHKLLNVEPSLMKLEVKKGQTVDFKFSTLNTINASDVSLIIFSGNLEKPLDIYDVSLENGIIKFKYEFKFRGYFDIHLKIADDIVATYAVKSVKG